MGRGITRFRFAERLNEGTSDEFLVLVTEPAGPRTLRQHLRDEGRSGILGAARRQDLWQAIHTLVEGVNALHQAHYLYRAIRPENIFVQDRDGKAWLKLANFEWSLFLHNLADEFPKDERWFDRYTAPEVLVRRFQKKDSDPGEGFCSDVYSLGLVLFELLIRRLTEGEIGRFYNTSDHDERSHREWLRGLRGEVRNMLSKDDQKDERLLLLEMLEPTVALRRGDLDDLVQITARIAWDPSEIERLLSEQKPYLTTTLFRGTPASIERFLEPFVRPGELGHSEDDLKAFVQKELSGARIYRNGGDPHHPLVVEGRHILFTTTPFEHDFGTAGGVKDRVPEVPYLTVATSLDRKDWPSLVRLPHDVTVVNIQAAHRDIDRSPADVIRRGSAWKRLFALAAAGADRMPPECREFYTILQTTAEVEEELWKQQLAPYRVIARAEESGTKVVVIRRRGDTGQRRQLSVDRLIARQSMRGERFFELGTAGNPLAVLQGHRVWKLESVDTGKGTVQLSREGGDWPPEEGYARPQSLIGGRAIMQRRSEVLQHLRDDEYLLKAVAAVRAVRETEPIADLRFFDESLDPDKKRIVRQILENSPLYLVQGPPGTGKTTLAAEVIRQTLARNPAARILITSQAHEPLNNLLLRVNDAFERVDQHDRPAAVRLVSSSRLQWNRWTRATREVMRRFQPAEAAKRHIEIAGRWQPSGDSRIDSELLGKWRGWIQKHTKTLPVELERRIVSSANLVYATANDRSIAELPEHREFDLLIFEEAAKVYPLEVLGPMRLSRRWLLIGDHEQLSAFNIEEFRNTARFAVRRLYGENRRLMVRGGGFLGDATGGSDPGDVASSVANFFEYLFKKNDSDRAGRRISDRLTLQWRMHPQMSRLLREIYYEFLRDGDANLLTIRHAHRVLQPDEFRRHAIVWVDVPPVRSRARGIRGLSDEELTAEVPSVGGGFRNPYEARVLHNLMVKLQASGRAGLHGDVAFLSPYKAQVDLINTFFRSWDGQRNPHTGDLRQRAYTVDSFQGKQAEVVAVSLVRNNPALAGAEAYGFLDGEEGRARAAVMF